MATRRATSLKTTFKWTFSIGKIIFVAFAAGFVCGCLVAGVF